MTKVFIDGEAGTTGLQIRERLANMPAVQVLSIAHDQRKNPDAKRDLLSAADVVILNDEGKVTEVYAAHDSGRVINPIAIQGQIEGGVLDGASRIAIQMAHRMMAVVALGYLLWLAMRLFRLPGMRPWGAGLGLLALVQVALGVLNVKLALPLAVAVLHNAGALALLFVLVTLLARLKEPEPLA